MRSINLTLFALCAILLWAGAAQAQRYVDNGDGTVSDLTTGLMWEKKTGSLDPTTRTSNVHDVNNTWTWSASGTKPDGTAFVVFLATLNHGVSSDGATTTNCFANHCDWRLPTMYELLGILDKTLPYCTLQIPEQACIPLIFGPTQGKIGYWSATTRTPVVGGNFVDGTPDSAWEVNFSGFSLLSAQPTPVVKDGKLFVRAVRGGS